MDLSHVMLTSMCEPSQTNISINMIHTRVSMHVTSGQHFVQGISNIIEQYVYYHTHLVLRLQTQDWLCFIVFTVTKKRQTKRVYNKRLQKQQHFEFRKENHSYVKHIVCERHGHRKFKEAVHPCECEETRWM